MGLYYDKEFSGNTSGGDSLFETKNLHSSHYGTNSIDEYGNDEGWRTFLDTDKFWLSSGTVDSEPNGDYVPNTWLGFSWDDNGDIDNFNDRPNKYGYSSYLCTQQY
jgi:restriction endonuclease S subunit